MRYSGWGKTSDLPERLEQEAARDDAGDWEEYQYTPLGFGKLDPVTVRRKRPGTGAGSERTAAASAPAKLRYTVGVWNGRAKRWDGCPDSLRGISRRRDFRKAHDAAKTRSYSRADRDFTDSASRGDSVVLIEYMGVRPQRVWEFDRNGRERLILDFTRTNPE